MTTVTFPDGFVWGAATAAYQIEGAADADGRTPSIWDTFSHGARPNGKPNVRNGDTGDVACDHYHRLDADLDLMSQLGLGAYRFSVSWNRVLPEGIGPNAGGKVNEAGLDFYRRLVDGLRERDIEPVMTLYHWDLPQVLEDAGGWRNRSIADRFAEYATVVGKAIGDRVGAISTLNEPWCIAYLGHSIGVHAPGIRDQATALRVAHHLNLAHGRAITALRSVVPTSTRLGITLNIAELKPASDDAADVDAAATVERLANEIFLGPILGDGYPGALFADTADVTDWEFVHDGDLAEIAAPLDQIGLNYYTTSLVSTASGNPLTVAPETPHADVTPHAGEVTAMGWPIVPAGLTKQLVRISERAKGIAIYIHENGAAFDDVVGDDGSIDDTNRIDYLRAHFHAVADAIAAGADVRGYFVWSLLDNFEWSYGYDKRFGIIRVDYDTLERTPKASAQWYADVIRAGTIA